MLSEVRSNVESRGGVHGRLSSWLHDQFTYLIVLVLDIEILEVMSFAYSLDNYARIFINQC